MTLHKQIREHNGIATLLIQKIDLCMEEDEYNLNNYFMLGKNILIKIVTLRLHICN